MNKEFDLTLYKKAANGMVAKNGEVYQDWYNKRRSVSKVKDYTLEQVEKIINSGSLDEQKELSRNYFYKDGIYKRIILYYASLLKYCGILVPDIGLKKLDDAYILKRYNQALSFVDKMSLPTFLTNCAIKAFVDGTYYGIIQKMDKNTFVVLNLPSAYCTSRFKDVNGNDIIEFDLSYFNSIFEEEHRLAALNNFPENVVQAYHDWRNGKKTNKWVFIDTQVSICFPFLEDGRPPFISTIPSTIQYDTAVDTDQKRDMDEIKKILIQKVPHLTTGDLLFEPEEAEEMHAAAVGMLKNNENLSVLTTYNDIDAIISKTSAETANSTLERMLQNIYSNTGASAQVFSSTGSSTLESSINNDIAYVMILGNKFSVFITNVINLLYGNGNLSFRYKILPVSYYNQNKYLDLVHKLANSGYSFLLPSIVADLSQKDLVNIKYLENNVLKLSELLIPLSSAYTQNAESNKTGRPQKAQEEKAPKTLQNEESLDNQT